MTAREAAAKPGDGPGGAAPPAPSSFPRPARILKRRDFLAAARARKWAAPSMIVQGRARKAAEPAPEDATRVGFTCSKKVGNAVARNRAKRRLRAAADALLPRLGRPGWDYVLIGRAGATAARPFPDLLSDLEQALARIHAPRKPR